MNLRPPPYWPCFASDWLAKEPFRLATLEERGLLFTMLNQAWITDSVPETSNDLARLLGLQVSEVEQALSARVLSAFQAKGDGRLICPELRDQKERMLARRAERSASGAKGAARTWRGRKRNPAKPKAKPKAEPSQNDKSSLEVEGSEIKRNALCSEGTDLQGWIDDYERNSR